MHHLSPVDAYIAHRKRIIDRFEVHKNCNLCLKNRTHGCHQVHARLKHIRQQIHRVGQVAGQQS